MTHKSAEVKAVFRDWLSDPKWAWNWVATQTFDEQKVPIHRNIVQCTWEAFVQRVGRDALISYGYCFGEVHLNGRPHWHALMHVSPNLYDQPRRSTIWKYMFERYGRCRIEPVRGSNLLKHSTGGTVVNGLASYLTKYVAKEAATDQAWWDFAGFICGHEASTRQIMGALHLEPVSL